jgi:hypothetical protein
MSRRIVLGVGLMVILAVALLSRWLAGPTSVPIFKAQNKPAEAAPICPWRNQESDLRALFPEATRTQPETRILTGKRAELTSRLGRPPTGDDHVVRLYRAYKGETELGVIQTRRVKGTFGAIEIVLGTDQQYRVRGVLFQRLREPEPIVRALRDPAWLGWLTGRNANEGWGSKPEMHDAEIQGSADAVLEGIRTMLILLETADHERDGAKAATAKPHH